MSGRDDHFTRFIGEGSDDPRPTFCVTLDGDEVVGWVDFDRDERDWLTHDEVNVGYALHPRVRGRGLATRSVHLLLSHLGRTTDVRTATLAIDRENLPSRAIARRAGFRLRGELGADHLYERRVPPTTYTDGTVTIRPFAPGDAETHLAGIDDEQIRWLWRPGEREQWAAMAPDEQAAHQQRWVAGLVERQGRGPYHAFAVVAGGVHVGYVDADLANPNAPAGEANVAYAMHPAHRGRGHAARAVRLLLRFLADHTGATDAHLAVEPANEPSLRVARAVGAREVERLHDTHGRTLLRHVVAVPRPSPSTD